MGPREQNPEKPTSDDVRVHVLVLSHKGILSSLQYKDELLTGGWGRSSVWSVYLTCQRS